MLCCQHRFSLHRYFSIEITVYLADTLTPWSFCAPDQWMLCHKCLWMSSVVSVWTVVVSMSSFFWGLVCLFGGMAEGPLPYFSCWSCCSVSLVVTFGLPLAYLYWLLVLKLLLLLNELRVNLAWSWKKEVLEQSHHLHARVEALQEEVHSQELSTIRLWWPLSPSCPP